MSKLNSVINKYKLTMIDYELDCFGGYLSNCFGGYLSDGRKITVRDLNHEDERFFIEFTPNIIYCFYTNKNLSFYTPTEKPGKYWTNDPTTFREALKKHKLQTEFEKLVNEN